MCDLKCTYCFFTVGGRDNHFGSEYKYYISNNLLLLIHLSDTSVNNLRMNVTIQDSHCHLVKLKVLFPHFVLRVATNLRFSLFCTGMVAKYQVIQKQEILKLSCNKIYLGRSTNCIIQSDNIYNIPVNEAFAL